MTFHAFIEYLKYRRKAQNRHGVHSPFVYAFVEDVLENRSRIVPDSTMLPWSQRPASRYDALIRRMVTYYGCSSICAADRDDIDMDPDTNAIMLIGDNPISWMQQIGRLSQTGHNTIIVLQDIHRSQGHTNAWEKICLDANVKLSIDLYGLGLLFFRADFKEKQHFILRGPR